MNIKESGKEADPENTRLRIAYVTSEMAPYAKTGGLADVSAALPAALISAGVDVHAILPLYRTVRESCVLKGSKEQIIPVPFRSSVIPTRILTLRPSPGLHVSFIEREEFFDRSGLYEQGGQEYLDNADRFIFFCRAALNLCARKDFRPDLFHCHDWQTALIPVYLKVSGDGKADVSPPVVLTIHNLAYQGNFPCETMKTAGLPEELFSMRGLEFYGRMSFLKGGLIFSDALTTVSPTYADEICTPEFGNGMEGVLQTRKKDLTGILNGVDYAVWNPDSDPFIAAPYSGGDLEGKSLCKRELLQIFGFESDMKGPLIGMVSRLAVQKGFDILAEAVPKLMDMGIKLIILGTGDPHIEKQMKILSRVYAGNMKVRTAFDNALAHKIEAGSDMFLMPSRYEPCGLNQMYSLKYGTIPIVKATGGLDDSVDSFSLETGKGTGFKFKKHSAASLVRSVKEATAVYNNPEVWNRLIRNAMEMDFSWSRSSLAYRELYQKMLKIK